MKIILFITTVLFSFCEFFLQTERIKNSGPDWSPDGKKLAYYSSRDGNNEIYIVDSNGNNPKRLTNNKVSDYLPKFSPDGNRILFFSGSGDEYNIFIMNTDGSERRQITYKGSYEDPNWIDSNTIIYNSDETGNHELFIFNLKTQVEKRLTNNSVRDFTPDVSPDGKRVLFIKSENSDISRTQLFVMNLDGSGSKGLSELEQVYTPVWSPSEDYVYFMHRDKTRKICSLNLLTGKVENLMEGPWNDKHPACSPDGSKLAFASDRDTKSDDIYVLDLQNGSVNRVTHDSKPAKN